MKFDDNQASIDTTLRQLAVRWVALHESEHERGLDGALGALASSQNGFIVAAETAYYGALETYRDESGGFANSYLLEYGTVQSECPEDRIPTLYAHYNDQGELLYVGMTIHAKKRQSQHKRTSPWRDEIASIAYWTFVDELWLNRVETFAICDWRPRYNKGAGR